MECDKLIEQMLKVWPDQDVDKSSDRLATLAADGKCSQYFGENYTNEKIDNMTNEEIKKLYARYESRLVPTMTNTIGSAMLQLYTVKASMFLPILAEHGMYLRESLEKDPFINHAISSVSFNNG